jgi:ATP-dependent protease ClpP protease subunit
MSATKTWFNVVNQTDNSADVEIYDEIGGWGVSAKEFIKGLKDLEGKHLNLRINSPGGSIIDGQAIIAALNRHTAGFTAWVEGLAASMASVIACAADKCFVADGSMMMIHRAATVSIGDADDLRKDASLLEKFEKGIVNIYANKTGMPCEEIEKMLAEETWMDALEAVALGFADGITDNTPAMAMVKPSELKARFDTFKKNMSAEPNPEPAAEPVTVAEPIIEPAPVVEEPKAEPTPDPVVEPIAEPVTAEPVALAKATEILNKYNDLVVERDTLKAELDNVKAILSAERVALDRLESSLGLASAKVEPKLSPASTVRVSLMEQYESITDPKEKAKFYAKNRDQFLSSI